MIAANVWHWWIGVALSVVGVLAVVALGLGYVKSVASPQHPSRKQRQALEAARAEAAESGGA